VIRRRADRITGYRVEGGPREKMNDPERVELFSPGLALSGVERQRPGENGKEEEMEAGASEMRTRPCFAPFGLL